MQILPKGASKGDGLRRLLELMDIDPKHVMAMGDGENDVSACANAFSHNAQRRLSLCEIFHINCCHLQQPLQRLT